MELITPRFDNLQNELRRELDPRGVLEEEVFQSLMEAAVNRRGATDARRYQHDRAFFAAVRELRTIQGWRGSNRPSGPKPPQPAAGMSGSRSNVVMFPGAYAGHSQFQLAA